MGLLDKIGGGRNIDEVIMPLHRAGYSCGYDVQDARDWFVPQSRKRVYVWAHMLGAQQGAVMHDDAIRGAKPSSHLRLGDCFLPT